MGVELDTFLVCYLRMKLDSWNGPILRHPHTAKNREAWVFVV